MSQDAVKKFKRRKRLRSLTHIFLYAFLGAIFLGVLIYSANIFFRVKAVEIYDDGKIDQSELKNHFDGKLIFFSSKGEEESLKEKFPLLAGAKISRNFFSRKVGINAKERTSWAVWCQNDCFYIDKNGLIFEPSPQFSGELLLKINDRRQIDFNEGDTVITAELIKKLMVFMEILKTGYNFTVQNITVGDGPEFRLTAVDPASGQFELVLDKETDFWRASENLSLLFNSVLKDRRENLDYIDLRFKDKVFFKSL